MIKYGMVIDASKCFNCKTCIVACQLENSVPPGYYRNWIKETEGQGTYLHFQPGNCLQCDEPSCVAACPVGATYKHQDGRVLINPSTCIGCGNCVPGCPYGARYLHPVKKIADKCDLCQRRLEQGLEPACVAACPTRARVFGDMNDPSSEISHVLKREAVVRVINVKVDTKPNVYYLEGTLPLTWPVEPTLPGNMHMPLEFWKRTDSRR